MRIHYACRDIKNVGDMIGSYILEKLGYDPIWSDTNRNHVMLAGSILQDATNKSLVLGSGFGARNQTVKGKPKIEIVRGEISSKMLINQGFVKSWQLGDPALALPLLFSPPRDVKYEVGIIPHYIDKNAIQPPCSLFIDVLQPVEKVIQDILSCEVTLSSSLHGLIISHAYGIPSLWVGCDLIAGDGMKYHDYFSSVGIKPYEPKTWLDRVPKETGEFDAQKLLNHISDCLLQYSHATNSK